MGDKVSSRTASVPARLELLWVATTAVDADAACAELARAGHKLHVGTPGNQIRGILEAHSIEVVLLDLDMPVRDRDEICRLLRGQELRRSRRYRMLLLVDPAEYEAVKKQWLNERTDAFLLKPLQVRDLVDMLGALGRSRQPDETTTPEKCQPKGTPGPESEPSNNPRIAVEADTPDAPVFDRGQVLLRFQGDKVLVRELVQMLLNELPQMMGRVEAALRAGDARELYVASHSLKGAAGYLQGKQVQQMGEMLEELAAREALDAAAELFPRLAEAVGCFHNTLTAEIAD